MLSKLETKIPPPVYGAITAFLIWWVSESLLTFSFSLPILNKAGIVFIIFGVSLDIAALLQFRKNRTTLNPLSPDKASTIVSSGLYQYTRNPMYLGMLIALTGWALMRGNLAGFVCLPLFVWVLTQMQIKPEERLLREKFGELYVQYTQNVRRWF